MAEHPINQNEIENRVYIGPNKTGDNIDAKRNAMYGWYPGASQWARVQVDANGVVQTSGSGGGGGLSVQDEAAWTAGTSNFTPSGGVFNDSATALTSGQQGTERLTPNRATHTNLRNNSGTEIATASNPVRTDPTGTTTQPVSAASLPLPTNAAQETGGNLATIATNTGNGATSANQTNGTQQTKITNGTNVADVVAGDTGLNGVVISSGVKTITFTTSTPGAQTIAANTDCRGYSWIEVVYTSVGSGLAVNGQFSTASGGTYLNQNVWAQSNGIFSGGLGATNATVYNGPVKGNFFQIAVSALTSGTFAGTITLRAIAPPGGSVSAGQSGTWTVGSNSATGSAVPANAFLMGMADTTNLVPIRTRAFAGTQGATAASVLVTAPYLDNGTSSDMQKANTSGAIIAAGATTTQTSATQTTYNAAKLTVVINISAFTSGTATFTVNALTSSGYSYPLLASSALGSTGTTILEIFPGATVTANASANHAIPRQYQVVVSGTFSLTYGVDYVLSV